MVIIKTDFWVRLCFRPISNMLLRQFGGTFLIKQLDPLNDEQNSRVLRMMKWFLSLLKKPA